MKHKSNDKLYESYSALEDVIQHLAEDTYDDMLDDCYENTKIGSLSCLPCMKTVTNNVLYNDLSSHVDELMKFKILVRADSTALTLSLSMINPIW